MTVEPEPTCFQEPHRVVGVTHWTATNLELWLEPLDRPCAFRPGQFVLLDCRAQQAPERSYSIANAPREDGLISLLVTRVPGGQTSTWIHERLRVGDEVGVSGPYGTFVDDQRPATPRLYLAAGSGLAPIRSLIEATCASKTTGALTLIVSAQTEPDLIDPDRLVRLQARCPAFRFVRTLTRANGAPPPRKRIPALLAAGSDLGDHAVFAAGSPDFVAACAAAATQRGAQPERVRTEVYFGPGWSG